MKTKWLVIAATAISCVPMVASAEMSEFSLGAIASYSPRVYKDTPSNKTVFPMVGYEGEHFFIRGLGAGYRLFPLGGREGGAFRQNIVFRLKYDPRTLKPSDSTDPQIQQLDERKTSIFGGVGYQLITPVGLFELAGMTDTLGRSNGSYAQLSWKVPLMFKNWGIIPSAGYTYDDSKLNNYLYGVSAAESARSGIREFNAGADGSYFITLQSYLDITKRVRVTASVTYRNLEGDIEKSPIIESGVNTTTALGVSYVF
ncbi:MipA/OmpV family protein [Vibrio sp. S4M6]|nr:MipA/OmpV family protein [Vibrio sinus]